MDKERPDAIALAGEDDATSAREDDAASPEVGVVALASVTMPFFPEFAPEIPEISLCCRPLPRVRVEPELGRDAVPLFAFAETLPPAAVVLSVLCCSGAVECSCIADRGCLETGFPDAGFPDARDLPDEAACPDGIDGSGREWVVTSVAELTGAGVEVGLYVLFWFLTDLSVLVAAGRAGSAAAMGGLPEGSAFAVAGAPGGCAPVGACEGLSKK